MKVHIVDTGKDAIAYLDANIGESHLFALQLLQAASIPADSTLSVLSCSPVSVVQS
jgi:hypothetical protein